MSHTKILEELHELHSLDIPVSCHAKINNAYDLIEQLGQRNAEFVKEIEKLQHTVVLLENTIHELMGRS